MADPELEKIRQQRLAQLQGQHGVRKLRNKTNGVMLGVETSEATIFNNTNEISLNKILTFLSLNRGTIKFQASKIFSVLFFIG